MEVAWVESSRVAQAASSQGLLEQTGSLSGVCTLDILYVGLPVLRVSSGAGSAGEPGSACGPCSLNSWQLIL